MAAAGYGVLLLVAVLAATLAVYPAMFSALVVEDEGYVLISLHENLSGGALYDDVYSQWGPAFYVLMGGVFALPGLDLDHDAGRLVTLALWTATSLLCGASLLRFSGSLAVALAGGVVAFYALTPMVFSPMHPGGLLAFLLASIVAVAVFLLRIRPSTAMFAIGGLAAAAALIKVNVGLLAIAAIAFACANTVTPLRRVGAIRIAVALLLALTPFVLMASNLSEGWVLSYALVVGLSAAAIAIAASPLPGGLELRPLYALAAGIGTVAAVVLAVVFVQGTTVSGLIDGVVSRPLRQPDLFLGEVDLPPLAPLWGLLALCAATVTVWRSRTGASIPGSIRRLIPVARIGVGLGIWVAVLRVGGADPLAIAYLHPWHADSIGLVAPLAWVAAVPPRRDELSPSESFLRALIPTLAVMQLLHPYPIPGTQIAWGLFLFAVVGGICVADGLGELIGAPVAFGLSERRLIGELVVIGFLVVVLAAPVRDWATRVNDEYDAGAPPGLRGAERLRLPPEHAADLRALSSAIPGSCSSFLTLPGVNSLYLFTGLDPPTGMNAGPWPMLFDRSDQRRIVEQVRGMDGLCAVRNRAFVEDAIGTPDLPRRPLVGYIQRRFAPTETVSEYDIMQRTGSRR